jgi:hypothetical protein
MNIGAIFLGLGYISGVLCFSYRFLIKVGQTPLSLSLPTLYLSLLQPFSIFDGG